VRDSTARAYLQPIMHRANLEVITEALSHRIVIEDDRATSITATIAGKNVSLHASQEVIVAAGAIASPVLLQHSGIGSKESLSAAGVECVHQLPGVGENLQDHLEVYFQFHCKQPVSLNSKLGLLSKMMIGARWVLFKDGLGASNHFESCAFIRSRSGLKSPDIQYHFLPAAMRYDGTPSIAGHGFQVHVGPNKPKSRGRVKITSADVLAPPSILFNYYRDEEDKKAWRQCIHLTREIMQQPAMDSYRGAEIQPGLNIQSDSEIDAWVKQNVESAYHPAGSCKMGSADDPLAVVDNACRVHGLKSLRIVDASVFPSLPNGNINAPVIMVAEKIADAILGASPLPAAAVDIKAPTNWQTRQRDGSPVRQIKQE